MSDEQNAPPAPPDPPAPPAPKAKPRNPKFSVGIRGHDGSVSYVDDPSGGFYRQRRITLAGQNYEHVSDGENGTWVYAAM